MPLKNLSKAPFPWFGGKTHAAPAIWAALGDVEHFVDPFCGSLAALLLRPHLCNRPYHSETVNDVDGLLVNAWRSIQLHPEETAAWASNPVAEADLMARHLWLLRWRQERDIERLMADPDYCDPRAAGYWIWGQSSWIGGGWCSGKGPWRVSAEGRVERRAGAKEPGVKGARPCLVDNGKGVNHPGAREPGVAPDEELGFHPMTMPEIRRWFEFLSARLRHVRILNGDWRRALTYGASLTLSVRQGGACGILLDPPYSGELRDADLYSCDSGEVAADVRAWAAKEGSHPKKRIILAGFGEEHDELLSLGWRKIECRCEADREGVLREALRGARWFVSGFLRGGMGNLSTTDEDGVGHQQNQERLWLSPNCLSPEVAEDRQGSLFDDEENP